MVMMIVIAIIAMLVGIVRCEWAALPTRRAARVRADISSIEKALEIYKTIISFTQPPIRARRRWCKSPRWSRCRATGGKAATLDHAQRPVGRAVSLFGAPGLHDNPYDIYSYGADGVRGEGPNADIGNWATPRPTAPRATVGYCVTSLV